MGSACLEQRWQSCGSTLPTQCRGHVAYGSNSEELSVSKCLPSYTQKRTSPDTVGMSQKCQQETHASQQMAAHSIISSARAMSDCGIVRSSALAGRPGNRHSNSGRGRSGQGTDGTDRSARGGRE